MWYSFVWVLMLLESGNGVWALKEPATPLERAVAQFAFRSTWNQLLRLGAPWEPSFDVWTVSHNSQIICVCNPPFSRTCV